MKSKRAKKAAKKPPVKRAVKSSTRTTVTSSANGQKHTGKVLEGKSPKGLSFDPAGVEMMAMGADKQVDRPRPATTRYPVDMATFDVLKGEALISKAGSLQKKDSTVVLDRSSKKQASVTAGNFAEAAGAPISMAPVTAAPSMLAGFAGIPFTEWFPPDCTLAVGPNHVMVSVNASVALYNKTGGAAVFTRSLTSWFSNVIANAKIFDPKLIYDQHAGRWILLAAALGPSQTESYFLLSVSKSPDPNNSWWNYKIDATKDGNTPTTNWADYPSLGVDSQALYVTANMFKFGGAFSYAKVRIIPKKAIYSGGALVYHDLVRLKNGDGSLVFTAQPCHTFGAPGTQYLVNTVYPSPGAPQSKISLWSINNPTGTPSLTLRTIAVSPYFLPPDATQKGGGTPLNSGDVRILNAVSRGGSVWCAFNTAHNFGGIQNTASIQWMQINGGSGTLVQQGIFGARGLHYFYPAVMPDSNGNMILVFSRSGSGEFASVYFSGRKASDPPGSLQNSALLQAGQANYVRLDGSNRNRWGDYAGIGSDPADTLKVWFYSMYATNGNKWATQVGASKF